MITTEKSARLSRSARGSKPKPQKIPPVNVKARFPVTAAIQHGLPYAFCAVLTAFWGCTLACRKTTVFRIPMPTLALRSCRKNLGFGLRTPGTGSFPGQNASTQRMHRHGLPPIRCCEKRHETSAARNKGGQKQNGPPDSNPAGLLQDGLRRILDTWGRRHFSVFVLGPFCSISHGSTLRRKGWTDPTIPSQFFAFVLARGGCGRGASALPLNASESSLTAR